MKKILMSVAVIGFVGALAAGATSAYFSDTETSTGNTFTAGTLDLNIDGGNTNVVKFTVGNKAPGDTGTGYWTVKNVGTVDGFLDLENKVVVNNDNACNEPEDIVDDTCTTLLGGELGANLNVVLFVDADHNGIVDTGDVTLYTGTLDGLVSAMVADVAFAAGAEKYISMNWEIPSTVENIIQSDSVEFGMTLELGQTIGQ
jgi:predicted ribosomally synthesized peptide with SipW-like signal peptide